MVPMENVKSGLARFVDREIAPGLSGWDKVIEAAIPYVNDKMPVQIPVIGITLKIGRQELDALYKYIKGD